MGFLPNLATSGLLSHTLVKRLVWRFCLKQSASGVAFVCNTESRVNELCNDLEAVLLEGRPNCKDA